MSLNFAHLIILSTFALLSQASGVNLITECLPDLIDQQYGYNISCTFNITATLLSIYDISLNWTIPSLSTFTFDNESHFTDGQNPVNVYQGSQALATWDAITVPNTALLTVYLQPNISITRNQLISSTVTLEYYNISDDSSPQYLPFTLSQNVDIQFSLPSNDGPTVTASSYSLTTNEDESVSTNLYVIDPDFYEIQSDGLMAVNMSVINGTISLSSDYGGIFFLEGEDTNCSNLRMVGSLNAINQAINTVTFMPLTHQSGTAQITLSLSDQGVGGTGQPGSDSLSIDITILPIFEIPQLVAPFATYTIQEDTTFNLGDVSCSVTTELDPQYQWLQLRVTAIYGNFSFQGDDTGIDIDIEDHALSINDTAELLNTYFQNITYQPPSNFNEESNELETISLSLLDHANLSDAHSFDVIIESVNDAPTLSVVAAVSTDEDTAVSITVTIDDLDFHETWGATFTVVLSVSSGTISLNTRRGLYIESGSYIDSTSVQFQASKENANNALDPITYVPDLNYFGGDILSVAVNDNGHTGDHGGALWVNTTVTITIDESDGDDLVPIINGIGDYIQCFEDIECFMDSVSISIANMAKQSNTDFTVTLSVSDDMGFVSANPDGIPFVDFSAGDGTLDVTFTFYGNFSNINSAFHNFSFLSTTHNHGYQGSITLTVTNDLGESTVMTRNLYIDAVNDAPIITLPFSTVTINEDEGLQIVGITVYDEDLNDTWWGHFYCNISCQHGTLHLGASDGIQFIGDDHVDGTANIAMFGRAGLVQNAIRSIQYVPDSHYVGSDTITVYIDDAGNTGIGGVLSDTKSIVVTIDNVADPPMVHCPMYSVMTTEDTVTFIEGVSLLDTDSVSDPLYVWFTLNHGIINMTTFPLLEIETIYAVDESVESHSWRGMVNGSSTEIAASIGNLSYIPVLDYNQNCCGHEKLVITSSYDGTFGGGLESECDIDVFVQSVNDPPVINAESDSITVEEDEWVLLGLEVDDVDVMETAGGLFHVSLDSSDGTFDCDFWTGSWTMNGSVGTGYVQIVGATDKVMDTVRTCKFRGNMDFAGSTTVTVTAWDEGQSGSTLTPQVTTKLRS